jgi:hypothetical protein
MQIMLKEYIFFRQSIGVLIAIVGNVKNVTSAIGTQLPIPNIRRKITPSTAPGST